MDKELLLSHVDLVESQVGEGVPALLRIKFKVISAYDDGSASFRLMPKSIQPHDQDKDARVMRYLDRLIHHLARAASEKTQQTTVILVPNAANPGQHWQDIKEHVSRGHHSPRHDPKPSLHDHQPQRRTSIPSALMPVCHNSEVTCAEATGNCSGRGYCYKKYSSRDERVSSDCFACRCLETVIKKADGSVQKLQWGGPACEKRDISVPFFQIAAVGILLTGAIATAIGMLFNVGQEKLPSVIGAGVGPVRPQK